jgi:hypothetical protein
VGTRYRGQAKGSGSTDYELVEYEDGARFTQHSRVAYGDIRHRFRFEAVPEGTRLIQDVEIAPTFSGRLLQPWLTRQIQRRLRAIGAGIRQYLAAH